MDAGTIYIRAEFAITHIQKRDENLKLRMPHLRLVDPIDPVDMGLRLKNLDPTHLGQVWIWEKNWA